MSQIFINYRREQTPEDADKLFDWLTARYGDDQVFKDKDTIAAGANWRDAIETAVSEASLVLALIGDLWLEELQRRRDDEDDFLRHELETAFSLQIKVLPILVGGAKMPRRQDLPASLMDLAALQALSVAEYSRDERDELFAAVNRALGRPDLRVVQREYTQTQQPTEVPASSARASKSNTNKPSRARKTVAVPLGSLEQLEAAQEELDCYVRLYLDLESNDRTRKAQELVTMLRTQLGEKEPDGTSPTWWEVEKRLDEFKLLGSAARPPAALRDPIEQFDAKVAEGQKLVRSIIDGTIPAGETVASSARKLRDDCLYSIVDDSRRILNECRRNVEQRLRSVSNLVDLISTKHSKPAGGDVRREVTVSQELQEHRSGAAVRTNRELHGQRVVSGVTNWTR
ncbi:MAG TPA: toll/interleukin-1 receptor domain-containing protein [Gaiellaceae bacterium]|nr:toll/interleukin-1 receptor domain-containing protein [Gaiellaceae bacterium]